MNVTSNFSETPDRSEYLNICHALINEQPSMFCNTDSSKEISEGQRVPTSWVQLFQKTFARWYYGQLTTEKLGQEGGWPAGELV